ncbi:Pseudouridine synthase, partial [Rhizoctonia solani]
LNDYRRSMDSPDKGTGVRAYFRRKKNTLMARLTSRSVSNLSSSTPSIRPDTQSLPVEPAAPQSRSIADVVVPSSGPLQHSDTDQLPVATDPLEGPHAATDSATVRVPRPITPASSGIQALTSTLRTLHSAAQLSSNNCTEMEALAARLSSLAEWLQRHIEEAKSTAVSEFLEGIATASGVKLQRAARTDAGVHAAGNVVSLKMITEPPDTPDVVAKLNELLPLEIRVWTFVRSTNAFNSRACDSRLYEYMFPLSALLPPMPGTPMDRHTKPETLDLNGPDWNYWAHPEASKVETRRAWRIGRGQLMNHTFLTGSNGYQSCITVKVLCYIRLCRKMTTLLIFASRTGSPAVTLVPQTFSASKLIIPKAPALGLLLQEPRFGTYNKHVLEENELAAGRWQAYRIRELIEWEPLQEKIDPFKHAFIYSRIRAEEAKHSVFVAWLKFIEDYEGGEFKYLNARGEVPPEAVVHPGKKKRGTTDKFREYLWKNPTSKGDESITDSEDEDASKKLSADMEG